MQLPSDMKVKTYKVFGKTYVNIDTIVPFINADRGRLDIISRRLQEELDRNKELTTGLKFYISQVDFYVNRELQQQKDASIKDVFSCRDKKEVKILDNGIVICIGLLIAIICFFYPFWR